MTDRIVPRLSDSERTALIAAARSFLGVPFRHLGRSRRGVDCLGLVVCSMQAIGREMADRKAYGRDPVADGMAHAARAHFGAPVWRKGQPMSLQSGDVVLMQWDQEPNHVALITDYPHGGLAVIHALAHKSVRRVVEHRLAGPWPERITEGFR